MLTKHSVPWDLQQISTKTATRLGLLSHVLMILPWAWDFSRTLGRNVIDRLSQLNRFNYLMHLHRYFRIQCYHKIIFWGDFCRRYTGAHSRDRDKTQSLFWDENISTRDVNNFSSLNVHLLCLVCGELLQ